MNDSIYEILSKIEDLLRECGWDKEADWFQQRRAALRNSHPGSSAYLEVLQEIDRAIMGMGSFTDIPLIPKSKQTTMHAAQNEQWELAEALANAIDDCLRTAGKSAERREHDGTK